MKTLFALIALFCFAAPAMACDYVAPAPVVGVPGVPGVPLFAPSVSYGFAAPAVSYYSAPLIVPVPLLSPFAVGYNYAAPLVSSYGGYSYSSIGGGRVIVDRGLRRFGGVRVIVR